MLRCLPSRRRPWAGSKRGKQTVMHIACYQLLTDDVALPLPNDLPDLGETRDAQKIQWNAPDESEIAKDRSRRPVLCYQVELQSAEPFRLRVQLRDRNGALRTISTRSLCDRMARQVMDPFPANWVRSGNNRILFRRLAGQGRLFIRDVMVLYQRLVS